MPNTFTDNRDRWLLMSDIDYLGQFVKAWLAFNAWYRSAYGEPTDRGIVEEVKWNRNPVAARLRPLCELSSEEAEQFRTDIGLLHHRLERYELHHGKGDDKARIRLTSVVIRTEPPDIDETSYRGWTCRVERFPGGKLAVLVTKPDGTRQVDVRAHRFDEGDLGRDASFCSLSDNLKRRFGTRYRKMNPRVERDLTYGDADPIRCGTQDFRCGADFLFAGVLEVVYLMRCTLFHGELVPTREAAECYEPAYRIVRRFLDAVS